MISYYYRNLKDSKLNSPDTFRVGSWVHAQAPSTDELAQLVEQFKLDEGHLRDALDPDEMPRLEVEDDTTYVFTRYSHAKNNEITSAPILFVIGPKFVLTVATHEIPNWHLFTEGKIDIVTTQKTKLVLQLIRHLVGTYNTGLTQLGRRIRTARAGLNVVNVSNRNFVEFVAIEDGLNDYLSELIPTNVIFTSLLKGKQPNLSFYEDDRDLVEDLALSTMQSIEASKSNLRTIVNIRDAYSNIMTNNLNRQIKLLTSLTIVLMIPTIVSGFFGMNVAIPLEHFKEAFPLIVLATLAFCGYLIWLLNKNNWL